jgi:hypothetical protein
MLRPEPLVPLIRIYFSARNGSWFPVPDPTTNASDVIAHVVYYLGIGATIAIMAIELIKNWNHNKGKDNDLLSSTVAIILAFLLILLMKIDSEKAFGFYLFFFGLMALLFPLYLAFFVTFKILSIRRKWEVGPSAWTLIIYITYLPLNIFLVFVSMGGDFSCYAIMYAPLSFLLLLNVHRDFIRLDSIRRKNPDKGTGAWHYLN